ncbi:putative glucose-1-phosphate adenylyltransferase [Helianthus annuus]|nr:putative glucose-1-phosphate adenylyltransferase [Helianthus annuus]
MCDPLKCNLYSKLLIKFVSVGFVVQTDADRRLLAAKGSVPIGIGKNTHIKRAIIDKNARIGDNVKIINSDNIQEAARETEGYFIKSGIVTVIKDALIPSGSII